MTGAADTLHARQHAIDEQLHTLDAELAKIGAERSASTSDDEHDPEGSTLTSDWSRLIGLRQSAQHQQKLTEAALARVTAGTYGGCLRCGKPIGAARLGARPEAELCIDCATATQK